MREGDLQRQWEESRIASAKYNKRYKEIRIVEGEPNYLKQENLDRLRSGDDMRALAKLRCGNMKEMNKYWAVEENRICIFCGIGQDCISHYMEECNITKGWFNELGDDSEKKWKRL